MAVLDDASELLRPQAAEVVLDLAEAELDRVVVRCVGNVEDVLEAQPAHCILALLRGVCG